MRVLLADDDPIFRSLMARRLRKLGYEPMEAGDGLEAWRLYQEQDVNLVLCDWLMPELDGLGLCRRIRGQRKRQYTYIILITALNARVNYEAGIEAGADDLLNKTDDLDLLKARLQVAQRILALQDEVKQLQGLLPICQYCKRICDNQNLWTEIEAYIAEHSDADFSHGICPECMEKHVRPQLAEMRSRWAKRA
jgi:DNA-binding response OmpR family regulator